ncbi:DUF3846 domain-containing protein [Anaerotignum lactatifermentans]|uniref:DUF3846 domain-containing protein n=2 Tax=Anaerotignum lactatifermentans TaxID=160404 RepID=UPI001FA89B75|nr:DUF3846 domain-containing protein [Anaerotignum lactatifermentans]
MKENVIKVLKVKPHEHPEVYMLKNTLEAMQEAVGGYIDIVGLDDNVCILLNDEGKLIGLEGNRRIGSDIIVGDFFVVRRTGMTKPPVQLGVGKNTLV